MAIYRVHLPVEAGDLAGMAERARFIREGFSRPAFLLGPVWLLARRLWRPLILWCVAAGIVGLAIETGRLSGATGVWLYWLSALFLGVEGQNLVAAASERAGFRFADIATGEDRQSVELGYFSRLISHAPSPPPAPAAKPTHGPFGHGEVIGLFPESGG